MKSQQTESNCWKKRKILKVLFFSLILLFVSQCLVMFRFTLVQHMTVTNAVTNVSEHTWIKFDDFLKNVKTGEMFKAFVARNVTITSLGNFDKTGDKNQNKTENTKVGEINNGKLETNKVAKNLLHRKIPRIVKAEGSVRDTACDSCFEHNFKMIVNNEQICGGAEGSENVDLIIAINTQHKNREARNALRKTWLTSSKNNTANIRYVFLLGENNINEDLYHKAILEENEKYHDIIKEGFMDVYQNLTYKTVMALKWVKNYCSNAKYFLKTDDDMFINLPHLMDYLKKDGKNLDIKIGGSCRTNASPNRDIKSKYYTSLKIYEQKLFPEYCSGTAYVTSVSLAQKLYAISASTPFFHLEDIYIGLCLHRLKGHVINLPGFNRGRPNPVEPCLYKGIKLYTAHFMTPKLILYIWEKQCKGKH